MHTLPESYNAQKDIEFCVERLKAAERALMAFDAEHPGIVDAAPAVTTNHHKHIAGKEKLHDIKLHEEYERLKKDVVNAGLDVDWANGNRKWEANVLSRVDKQLAQQFESNAELRENGMPADLTEKEEAQTKKLIEKWAIETL